MLTYELDELDIKDGRTVSGEIILTDIQKDEDGGYFFGRLYIDSIDVYDKDGEKIEYNEDEIQGLIETNLNEEHANEKVGEYMRDE